MAEQCNSTNSPQCVASDAVLKVWGMINRHFEAALVSAGRSDAVTRAKTEIKSQVAELRDVVDNCVKRLTAIEDYIHELQRHEGRDAQDPLAFASRCDALTGDWHFLYLSTGNVFGYMKMIPETVTSHEDPDPETGSRRAAAFTVPLDVLDEAGAVDGEPHVRADGGLLVRVGRYVPILGERIDVLTMLSYTYKPARGTGQMIPCESPASDDTQTDRFLEAMEDDVVTLDYLIGVTPINGEYAFVQYKPTEKHKRCAGTKISPVHQINMFIQTLRDNGVSLETAICTIVDSNQRTLWLRIPLSELKELSLEPLWMIRGVVQLFGKQQCIAIAIDDRALANITLDPDTALLVDSCTRGQTEQTHREEEPTRRQQTPKGSPRSSPTETRKRKRTLASRDTDSVAVRKKTKPLCCDTVIRGNKQHRRHGDGTTREAFGLARRHSGRSCV
ncbi:chromosome alignment-maintaining phosphoprotein 1 [Sarotherodon galilaeus]